MEFQVFDERLEKPASLADRALERLRAAIVSGYFKPGERLVEATVSSSFGISRAPFREALRMLAADGLVALRQGKGAYVISPSSEQLEDMVLARVLVEGAAGRLIAARRSAESLARLQALFDEQKAAHLAHDEAEVVKTHWRFHEAICEESNNPYLLQLWRNVSNVLRIYSAKAVYKLALRANAVFLECMKHGAPAEAETLLRSQILFTSYIFIQRPVPEAVLDYLVCYVDYDRGEVRPIAPAMLPALLAAWRQRLMTTFSEASV